MRDDAAVAGVALIGARRYEHVPPVARRIGEYPRVAPRFFPPVGCPQRFVPLRVSDNQRALQFRPSVEVSGRGNSDGLYVHPGFGVQKSGAGVEHTPDPVITTNNATRPRGGLVEAAGLSRPQHRTKVGPRGEVE